MVDVERFASGQNRLGFSYLHYVYYVLSSHKTIDIVLFCFNSTATEEMRQWIGSRRPELVFVSGPRRRSRRPQRSLAPSKKVTCGPGRCNLLQIRTRAIGTRRSALR